MTDYEMLSIILMILSIVVSILIVSFLYLYDSR